MPLATSSEAARPPVQDGAIRPAVELSGVGVRFQLPTERLSSFKEYVLRRLTTRMSKRELWALDDVDLEILPGEVFGLVGGNGAGKSTLLKVVARVLHPTRGRVVLRGGVAPLLELGAGFHPDLSGRENIFLNGSILGHSRTVLAERIDEIVDFAELADFIAMPLRNYSSGMLVRLGFSVATLFRPDILLLDEILAVGDAGFQRKCLERMKEFKAGGTATVLVSHNLEIMKRMCDRIAWIDHGKVRRVGEPTEVAEEYQAVIAAAAG